MQRESAALRPYCDGHLGPSVLGTLRSRLGLRNLDDYFWQTADEDDQTKLIRRLWRDPALLSELRQLEREFLGDANTDLRQGTRDLSPAQKASIDNIAQRAGVARRLVIQAACPTAQHGEVLRTSFRDPEQVGAGEVFLVGDTITELATSVVQPPALPENSPQRVEFDATFARWIDGGQERYGPTGAIKTENARAFELMTDLAEMREDQVTGFYRFEDIKPHNAETVRIVGRITRSTGPLGQLLDTLPKRARKRLRKIVKDRVNVKDVHYVVVSVDDHVRAPRLKAIRAEVLLSSAYRADDFRPVTPNEEIQLVPMRSKTLGNGTSIVRAPQVIVEGHTPVPEFDSTVKLPDELLGSHVMNALMLGRPTHMPSLMTIFAEKSTRPGDGQSVKASRKGQKSAIVRCLDAHLRNPIAGVPPHQATPTLLAALADEFILRFEATQKAKSAKSRGEVKEFPNDVALHELDSTVRNDIMTSGGGSTRARALYAALERQQRSEFLAGILEDLPLVASQDFLRINANELVKYTKNALISLTGKTVFGEVVLGVAGVSLVVPSADFLKQCHYTGVRLEKFTGDESIALKLNRKSGEYFLYTARLDRGMKASEREYSFKDRAAKLVEGLPTYQEKVSVIGAGVSRYSQWVDRDRYKVAGLRVVGRKAHQRHVVPRRDKPRQSRSLSSALLRT